MPFDRDESHPAGASRHIHPSLWSAALENGDGGPEMRFGGIGERSHERMAFEHCLDDAALHSGAAAVDEADLGHAGPGRSSDILFDDRFHVAWRKGVEIKHPIDGHDTRGFAVIGHRS